MKNRLITAFLLLVLLFVPACSDNGKESPSEELVIPDGYERVDIGQANRFTLEGLGTQFDAHFWSPDNAGLTEEDWRIWMERLDAMGLDCVRIKILPDWYEISNDNEDPEILDLEGCDWDNVYMTALYRMLDACQTNGINVDLSFYGVRGGLSTNWLGCTSSNWISAPNDIDEFAESVYAGLYYLLEIKGYTCINEFSTYPEPTGCYLYDNDEFSYEGYVEMCKAVDAKLRREGLRERLIYSGAAEIRNTDYMKRCVENLNGVFDRYTGSWYQYRNESKNGDMAKDAARFVAMAAAVDKTYGVSEFGSNYFVSAAQQSDSDTFERALYIARFTTVTLAQGFTNLKYWVLGDVFYDGTLMELGLWKYKTENWAPRPQFFTYSLLTRYTAPGAKIYPLSLENGDYVNAVAFEIPDGSWTYVIVNASDETRKLTLVNEREGAPAALRKYEVTEEALPAQAVMVESTRTYTAIDRALSLEVKPQSFLLLTDMD